MDWLPGQPPCRVLVPGCGRGHEVVELASRGFEVVALDIAPTALEALEQDLRPCKLEAELVVADALTWMPHQGFDLIYEQTCFCALDPVHWPTYAQQLARWLKPGGRLLAAFMQTGAEGGPPYHCDLEVMRGHLPESVWEWPQGAPAKVAHPRGIFELVVQLRRTLPSAGH